MNARCMTEGVRADDGLVGLDGEAGNVADQTARSVDLSSVDVGRYTQSVPARFDGHDDLFERCVPCALAQSVDAPLHLPRAFYDRRNAVRRSVAQVVVAVDADDRPIDIPHVFLDAANTIRELRRQSVSYRVRNVHRRCSCIDARFQHPIQVLDVGSRGVHRREFDVIAQVPRSLD